MTISNLSKKTVVVFGGLGLIGKQISKSLLANNAKVIVADKNIKKNNQNFYRVNANDEKELKKFIFKLEKKYKKIDTVINCIYPKFESKKKIFLKISKFNFLKDINYHLGTFFILNQIFCKYFIKKKDGQIINFSSIYGNFIPRFEIYEGSNVSMNLDYMISKNSIINMSKYLAKEMMKYNIRVNIISPGGVFDNQHKIFVKKYSKFCRSKKMLNPNDISGIVNFLVSDSSNKITGQNILVDDGFTL